MSASSLSLSKANFLRRGIAVHHRHLTVHQDQIHWMPGELIQGMLAVVGFDNIDAE